MVIRFNLRVNKVLKKYLLFNIYSWNRNFLRRKKNYSLLSLFSLSTHACTQMMIFLSYFYQLANCLRKHERLSQVSRQSFYGKVDLKVQLKSRKTISRTEFEEDSLFLGTYFRVDEREKSSQSTIVAISGAGWVGTARDSIFRTTPGHRLIPSLFTAMPEDTSRKLKRGDVDPWSTLGSPTRPVRTVRAATSTKSTDFPRATPRGRTTPPSRGGQRWKRKRKRRRRKQKEGLVEGAGGGFQPGIGEEETADVEQRRYAVVCAFARS